MCGRPIALVGLEPCTIPQIQRLSVGLFCENPLISQHVSRVDTILSQGKFGKQI